MSILNDDLLKLWYDRPASEWLEALPIGNGRIGAMVFGGVVDDELQLNECTLWSGGPHDYNSPEALSALPEIRRLVFDEQWSKAQDLVNAKFMSRPLTQAAYQTIGRIRLIHDGAGETSGYRRDLNLTTAVATTKYFRDGAEFVQTVFASYPDNVIVLRLTASKPIFSLKVYFESPHASTAAAESDSLLVLSGKNEPHEGIPGALTFTALADIQQTGGHASHTGSQIVITNASEVTVRIAIATSYKRYDDVTGNAAESAATILARAKSTSFAQQLSRHISDYQALFNRVQIDLGSSLLSSQSTNVRVRTFADNHDPALVSLIFQYGRYLLISSSRPGGQPSNLQGIWNKDLQPAWGSKYTININTEMNYWAAGPANLIECAEPLYKMISEIAETGSTTAKVLYGANGWVAHHNTDLWRGTAPIDGAQWGMWPSGGAWLCKSLWEDFLFTGNADRLSEHYPLLKGAAAFFLSTLVTDPDTGFLVTNPSNSPENQHHPDVTICAGPTMDILIIRDLFKSVITAAEVLNVRDDITQHITSALSKLPPLKIGPDGRLQEWLKAWDTDAPEQDHRHVSHMYALHPSNQISPRQTPDLSKAAVKTLEMRGDMATGWSLAWKVNFWARILDGNRAHKLISDLLTPERTAPNLFDLHPPFQIDGNFGATAGVCEMLLQSQNGEIELLPALPSLWQNGSVSGLRARGGIEVSIGWSAGKLVSAILKADTNRRVSVRYGEALNDIVLEGGKEFIFERVD